MIEPIDPNPRVSKELREVGWQPNPPDLIAKINELVEAHNQLEAKYQSHTHHTGCSSFYRDAEGNFISTPQVSSPPLEGDNK